MKRLLFFLMATLFAMQGFSQATLNEGFEGTNFPPDDWTKVTTQGTEAWERYTSDAPRGLACASVNYDDPSHINYLITPKLIVSSDQDSIVYWVKTSYDFGGTTLNVLVSTTDNAVTSFSTTSLQTVSTLSESWVRKSIPLTNYIGQEIYIAFQVVDFYGSRVMLDDVTGPELFVPTCPKPSSLVVSNPTTSGVDLAWTDATGSAWNIQYMLASETDWTNATLITGATNPYTFTTLNPASTYKTRVQTDCGIEQSDWSSSITFMTGCDAITTLPYSENFDAYGTTSGSFVPCWSRPVLNTTTPFPSLVTTNHTPPASIKFQSASATTPTYVVTPQFADDIETLRLRFWLRAENTTNSGTMHIGVMSDPTDLSTFELVSTIVPTTTTFQQYEFLLNNVTLTGPNNYIAFKHVTSASNYFYWLDDVVVDYIPSCPKPTALTASNPTTIGIDLGWTDDVGSAWNIQYMLATETDWANATLISGATNPYTFTTLNPSTTYKVRVQSDCGAEQSEWSDIMTFTTACGAITNLPYSESFDAYGTTSGSFVPCWSRPVLNTTTPFPSIETTNNSAPASIKFQSSSASAPTYVITPQFADDINLLRVKFFLKREGANSGTMEVGVMSDPNDLTSFELVATIDPSLNDWIEYEFLFSGTDITGPNNYIAFRHITNLSNWFYWLDDVVVDYIPSCPKPAALTATNITATDADLGWTDDAGSMWTIQYMLASETDWANATEIAGVASNPYPIIGLLSPASNYKFRVQSLCGAEESEWSNVATFTTPCVPLSQFPWTEGFESILAANTLPPCWSATSLGTKTGTIITTGNSYNRNARTGTGAAWFKWSCNDSFKTPEFQLTENTSYDFSFWYVTDGDDGWTSLKAELWDATSNTLVSVLGTPVLNPTNETYQIYSSTFTIPDETATYYIAIKCVATDVPYYLTLDDISLELTPDCPNVYGLTVGAASTISVSVNWNDEGDQGDGYVIAYSSNLSGPFDPTTATTVAIPTGSPLPYIVPGFNPGDSVWVAVQRGCGGAWTNTIKVNLPTFANTLPLTANFEDPTEDNIWTITNGTQTNKWYIGVPGANDSDPTDGIDERGLYISSDNGATVSYNANSSTVSFVSTVVELDNSPSFELSFDWANWGESCCDFINVYLLPYGETLTPGTLPSGLYKVNSVVLNQQSSFQRYTVALNATYSNSVRQLVFAWKNDGSTGSNPAKIDNINFVALTCGMPYGLAMDSASYNGTDVYLHWTESQGATDWIVEYQQTGTTAWQQVAANSNPFTLTGLNPGTSYKARVRSICNASDTSAISNVINFQTACTPLTIPTIVEGFNTVPPSTCWDRKTGILPTTGNATLTSTTSGWYSHSTPMMPSSGNHAYINIWSTSTKYWLISPTYDLGDGTIPAQIEFDAILSNYAGTGAPITTGTDDKFAVVVSTDNGLTWNAANAFVWSNDSAATRVYNNLYPLKHIILPLFDPATSLPYTGNVKIAFYGESTISNADNYLHLDNFEIIPFATCQRPTSLGASAIASTSANVSFQENGTSTTWQYVLTDGTITDPSNGTPVSTTDNPIQLTGLTPQTQYTIWIRSDCTTETSIWSTPLTFVTEAPPATVPYSFDFENQTEALAWRNLSGSVNNWAIGQAAGNGPSTQNTTDNTAAYISNNNGVSYAMTDGYIYAYGYRDIDFGSTPASYSLTFDWKCQGDVEGSSAYSGLIVYLRDPAEVLNPTGYPTNVNDNLGLFAQQSTWQTDQLPLDNVSGVKRLIFFYFDNYSNYAPPAAIDNISIVAEPCPRPFDVTVSNTTTTTAEVSWNHPGATDFIVSYRTNTTGSTLIDIPATSSPIIIQGLTSGTAYLLAVRAICNGDTTIYSETVQFTTPCADGAISSFPWIEGFESGLMCWTISSSVTSANWTSIPSGTWPTATPHSGSNMIMFNSNSISSGGWSTLYSPLLDFPNDQYQISFWLFRDNADYLTNADRVELYVNSTASETGAALLGTVNRSYSLAPIETSGGWYQYTFNLPAGMTGNNYVILKGISAYGRNVYVDDLMVDGLGTPCPAPTNITVTSSNTSANVTWTAGDAETSWEVRLGTTGTPETVSSTNHPLTGLTPSTTYTVYVRANCGTGYSSWIPKQFTTTSQPTPPTVTTAVPSTLISQTTAVLNGTYVEVSDPILTTGFEYKTVAETTWTDQLLVDATTPFTYSPTGLTPNTAYEAKAYVTTTTFDKTYGNVVAFTTLAIIPPTVTTDSVRVVTETSANFYGKIIENTEAIEARGFEYKLSSEAWDDAINISASGVTTITATANTLTNGMSYDVRAYGRTLSETTYGLPLTFTPGSLNGVNGQEISIMMYPNPATSQTNLVVSGINGETKIVLSDVQGRILNTINAKPVSGTLEQTIDLNNLAKGIYYIRIQNSDINRTQKLIVK